MAGLGEPVDRDFDAAFRRVLDDAMRLQQIAEAIDRSPAAAGREELRDAALRERHTIAASAGTEYHEYRRLLATTSARAGRRPAAGCRRAASRSAAGQPMMPMLARRGAAGAALICLLSGYAARSFGGRPYVGDGLITAGLLVGAMAVGAAIGDLIWLTVEARRRSVGEDDGAEHDDAVGSTWKAWEATLLERGVVPFLLARLEEMRTRERDDRATR